MTQLSGKKAPLVARHQFWMQGSSISTIGCLFWILGCATVPPSVNETDPFDAAHRQMEAQSHQILIARATSILQEPRPNINELNTVTADLKQALMESQVSKSGIKPKVRRVMEQKVSQLAHRHSMEMPRASQANLAVPQLNGGPPSFTWPLKPVRIESSFGLRTDPFGSEKRLFHNGIDLSAPMGTPVYSPAPGTVLQTGWRENGCGLGITLAHGGQMMSDYCHLSKVAVVMGQRLQQGDQIGKVGQSGRSKAPHLHWSVWRRGRAIDPSTLVSGPSH